MFILFILIGLAHATGKSIFDYKIYGKNIHYERQESSVRLDGDGINDNYKIAACERAAFKALEARIYKLASQAKVLGWPAQPLGKGKLIEIKIEGLGSLRVLGSDPLGGLLLGLQTEMFLTKTIGEQRCRK